MWWFFKKKKEPEILNLKKYEKISLKQTKLALLERKKWLKKMEPRREKLDLEYIIFMLENITKHIKDIEQQEVNNEVSIQDS